MIHIKFTHSIMLIQSPHSFAQIMVGDMNQDTIIEEFDPPLNYNRTREGAKTKYFVDFSQEGGGSLRCYPEFYFRFYN